jgi:hypothetical protein
MTQVAGADVHGSELGETVKNKRDRDRSGGWHVLYHPSGTQVKVYGQTRADVLKGRGYTEQPPNNRTRTEALVPDAGYHTAEHSVDEVLDWVGDDVDRANEALESEQGRTKSRVRSTLVEALEKIIDEDAE